MVKPASSKQVLMATKTDESKRDKLKMTEGPSKKHNGSSFFSYTADVQNVDMVREFYYKLKAKHQTVDHIMCTYRIFGANFPKLQDYSDDGEYGGGHHIFNVMHSISVWNCAVFVVRYHEGPNLGKKRFEIITELAEQVIAATPHGLNYGLGFEDKALVRAFTLNKKESATRRGVQEREPVPTDRQT